MASYPVQKPRRDKVNVGERQVMFGSPLFQEVLDEVLPEYIHKEKRNAIKRVLMRRFAAVPPEIASKVEQMTDPVRLDALLDEAVVCPTLEAFRSKLSGPSTAP